MDSVQFVDTTLRDGHASLWAENMTTDMMTAVAPWMDQAGFLAMEVIGTSHFKKCIRELREDPWERLRALSRLLPHTPMAVMAGNGSPNTFGIAPAPLAQLYYDRLYANGIRRVHLMEPSNDMARLSPASRRAQAAGLEVMAALTYTISPKHSDDYYVEKAGAALAAGVDRLYLKDPGGLLTPERIRTLVPRLLAFAGPSRLELHSHCTTGLAPICYLEAVQAGIRVIHTALPPLALGSSQPSLFSMVKNLEASRIPCQVELDPARTASERLVELARARGFPAGTLPEYDVAQYLHQVPGGVISNLRHQLRQMGMLQRLDEVLQETIRVRADLGYPIMVTPFSQFIVSQATINVLLGERYREVPDEILLYATGYFGEEARSGVDPAVASHLLGRRRAQELMTRQEAELTLGDWRKRLGGSTITDDDLVLYFIMGGRDEVDSMRRTPLPMRPQSLSRLVQELVKTAPGQSLYVRRPDLSITAVPR